MQVMKSFVAILLVGVFLNLKPIHAAAAYRDSSRICWTLLSPELQSLNLQERKFIQASVDLTQQAMDKSLISFPDLANSLAIEGYRFYQTLFKGYFREINIFTQPTAHSVYDASSPVREYVDSIQALDPSGVVMNNPLVGKAIFLRLLSYQEVNTLPDMDRMWSRLSAARVLNAMIKDGHLLNRQYIEKVVHEAAREIDVYKVYPDGNHMDVKLSAWIKEGQWASKEAAIKRISFFVLQSLRAQTKDFAKYRFLINIEHNEKPVFEAFLREFIEATVVDSLKLAAATLHERPRTFIESVKDVRDDALLAAVATGAVAGVYMTNTEALGAAAGVGAVCGSSLLTLKAYDNLKVWLAQRRLRMNWLAATEKKCHNYYNVVLEMMRE